MIRPQIWEDDDVALLDDIADPYHIIVYNDDVNSFEWVIECFMKVLGHAPEQSEQLAHIIHYKGKANVKRGGISELRPLAEALLDKGLSAKIE
jgi:ATP-dependent Clp protease adaptor protein ClpS